MIVGSVVIIIIITIIIISRSINFLYECGMGGHLCSNFSHRSQRRSIIIRCHHHHSHRRRISSDYHLSNLLSLSQSSSYRMFWRHQLYFPSLAPALKVFLIRRSSRWCNIETKRNIRSREYRTILFWKGSQNSETWMFLLFL